MAEEFDPVLAEAQAQVLREELTQYDLDEEDFGLLELELDEDYHDGYRHPHQFSQSLDALT